MVDTSVSTGVSGAPYAAGWESAATAVHAIRKFHDPMLLSLEAAGHPPMVIDFRHRAFAWDAPLSAFPQAPDSVYVATQAIGPADPAPFPLPGRSVDALLWMIGLHAFPSGPAPWRKPGERYRLSRWPNLTDLPHDPDQLRMIAALGNVSLDAAELAESTGTDPVPAQRLLNALTLMDAVRVSEPIAFDVPMVRPRPDRRGLFARLRDRLGR